MTKLLIILLCLPMVLLAQQTYVPDDNFEQALINLGFDNVMDDYVITSAINSVSILDVSGANISDLSGIEAFTSLAYLDCYNNQLTSLDVSNNTVLTYLRCYDNLLTSLDVSNNLALTNLNCYNNLLTSLDVSNNLALTDLYCNNNQLTSLDVRNGNNTNILYINALSNLNLYCIDVDDPTWSAANWTGIDALASFSEDCGIALGCTESLACNYDATATINDGSCSFPATSTTATNSTCNGLSDGTATTNPSGGTAPYTYLWTNGQTTSTLTGLSPGAYTCTITDAYGCIFTSSTVVITEPNPDLSNSSITTCDTYSWNGMAYTTSGTYTNTYTNSSGCDSIHTLNLTINYSPNTTNVLGVNNVNFLQIENYSVAQNLNSTFAWNLNSGGIIINGINTNSVEVQWGNMSSSYDLYVIETNQYGCSDTSLIVINANCLPNTNSSTMTTCDAFVDIFGTTYTTSGAYTNTYTNALGCDSTHTLNLTIINSTTSTDVVVACDSYTWLDGVTYTASNNTATFTSTNAAGCDNIATLALTIINSTTSTDVVTACDSYTWLDGVTYAASNSTATFTSTNAAGCNNVATLVLTINNSTTSSTSPTVTNAYSWNGIVYTISGIYTYSTTNVNGCDSTATLNLTITNISAVLNIKRNTKTILKVTDLLGRETKGTKNEVLFYIYDDGTVEKKIILE